MCRSLLGKLEREQVFPSTASSKCEDAVTGESAQSQSGWSKEKPGGIARKEREPTGENEGERREKKSNKPSIGETFF